MSAQLICAVIQIWCQGALFLASPGWASFRQRQRRRKELPPILLLLLPPPRRLLLLLLLLLLRKISGRPFGVGSGRWVFFPCHIFLCQRAWPPERSPCSSLARGGAPRIQPPSITHCPPGPIKRSVLITNPARLKYYLHSPATSPFI